MLTRRKASRLSLFTCLAISVASYAYALFGPANINLNLLLAAPLAVIIVGLGARALSTPFEDAD